MKEIRWSPKAFELNSNHGIYAICKFFLTMIFYVSPEEVDFLLFVERGYFSAKNQRLTSNWTTHERLER